MSEGATPRSTGSTAAVAYEALNLGKQNSRDISQHEDICAERYRNINQSMAKIETSVDKQFGEIKGILKWAGGAAFAIIIGLLSFLAQAQFTATDLARKEAALKIETLERQVRQQPVAAPLPAQP